MSWAWVQDDTNFVDINATTIAKAFTSNVTAGSLLVVLVTHNGGTGTATCADSLGQTFTLAVGPTQTPDTTFNQWIFYFPNSSAGANTVTVTFSVNSNRSRLAILEYSGIATTSPLDVTAAANGTSAAPNSGAATTGSANELIFGGAISFQPDTTAGAGFTSRQAADGFDRPEDKNGAAAGATARRLRVRPISGSPRW